MPGFEFFNSISEEQKIFFDKMDLFSLNILLPGRMLIYF